MITIFIPNNYIQEREYIVNILFGDYLGLQFSIVYVDQVDYTILLENGNQLVIKDNFFSKIPEYPCYLSKNNIPKEVLYAFNVFTIEENIPVIYGTDQCSVSANKIICGIDIFASSFFMLTRWEEYVNKIRDKHNRFPAEASTAYKYNFLDRPVVNEYTEMLWNMLRYLGIEQDRKRRDFQFVLTHDVDYIDYWRSFVQIPRRVIGELFRSKSIKQASNILSNFIQVNRGEVKDPYDTFEWLMDLSEQIKVKSHFYFMSGGKTKYDNNYRIDEAKAKKIIQQIKERDHIIGFHPSYVTYNDLDKWCKEKQDLESVIEINVTEGRQHYLRFEVPSTWQIWEDCGMKIDRTLSYADKEGFRCGTCYEYSVFNILTRKKLNLVESPLIVMEGSFVSYQAVTCGYMEEKINELLKRVKKYNGNFVFLWHNSSFNHSVWKEYEDIYYRIINQYSRVDTYD